MKLVLGATALLMVASAGAAAAPLTYTPILSGGSYPGSLAPLNDGVIPANGSAYNTAAEVHDYSSATVFSLNFSAPVTISDILANVDNNDDYTFAFYDFSQGGGGSAVPKLTLVIHASDGFVGGGMETFGSFTASGVTTLAALQFAPVRATTINVYSSNGDGFYAVGEVQFFGSADAAVPEPATWAMLIAGFGLVGVATRRGRPVLA